ncbi:hinge connector of long tail fiber distal connector [Acinetobacter phage AB1I1M-1]
MADLKAGTTIGGSLVWTQGNFPLFPTGNTLLYKTFKVYSENDKPQAIDNDFVSKAEGGAYLKNIYAPYIGVGDNLGTGKGISLYGAAPQTGAPSYGIHFSLQSAFGTFNGNNSSWGTYFQNEAGSTHPWLFRTGESCVAAITAGGDIHARNCIATVTPTQPAHLTRKDYVDGQINNVNTNANNRVLRAGDTMTGNLSVPNLVSRNVATAANQVPQLSQVVTKGTILDYGTF